MSKMLISNELCAALCQQLAHERYNAGFYMYFAGILENKGLSKLAKLMMEQYEEELQHARQIFEYLTDMNAPVKINFIPEVSINIESIAQLANLYLERELVTTEQLKEIKNLIMSECDDVSEEFIRGMLHYQVHELREAGHFVDNAELCGDDWHKAKLWNDSL